MTSGGSRRSQNRGAVMFNLPCQLDGFGITSETLLVGLSVRLFQEEGKTRLESRWHRPGWAA